MDSAKATVQGFLSKSGKHDTTVHETVAPAVVNETINQHRHEEVATAVDREVHQDHHHTTVQPVNDTQTLAEKHHHKVAAVEHKTFEHGNDDEVRRRLEADRAQFKDTTVKGDVKHTHSVAPTVVGEHVHHHVHETIQPVVNRQVVEPHVVHTTVPIHETHHSAAKHHAASALPAMSMADFKKQGGSLAGREERSDFFKGEPRNGAGHEPLEGRSSPEFRKTGHVDTHTGVAGTTGTTDTLGHSTTTGTTGSTGRVGTDGAIGSSTTGTTSSTIDDDATSTKKPSLLSRLNPLKDSDGDGKKGIMD